MLSDASIQIIFSGIAKLHQINLHQERRENSILSHLQCLTGTSINLRKQRRVLLRMDGLKLEIVLFVSKIKFIKKPFVVNPVHGEG